MLNRCYIEEGYLIKGKMINIVNLLKNIMKSQVCYKIITLNLPIYMTLKPALKRIGINQIFPNGRYHFQKINKEWSTNT